MTIFYKGLLPFASILAAIIIYRHPLFFGLLVLAFVVAGACGLFVHHMAAQAPRVATVVVNGWMAMPPTLLVTGSLIVIVVTLRAPVWLKMPDEKETDVLAATLVGASTAYIAALWTDDITKKEGSFWPGKLLQASWSEAFKGHPSFNIENGVPRSPKAEAAYHAIFSEDLDNGKVTGWGFIARWKRATRVSAWLKSL